MGEAAADAHHCFLFIVTDVNLSPLSYVSAEKIIRAGESLRSVINSQHEFICGCVPGGE